MDINVPLFHSYSRFEIRKNCRRSNAQLRMIKVHGNAIFCHPASGANFGGSDLWITGNANTNQASYAKLGSGYKPPQGYQSGTLQTISLLAGSKTFSPTNIEVFR
jgi:hypothetical protein